MQFNIEHNNIWVLIGFKGRMDSFTYEHISDRINVLLRMGKKFIAIDLSETEFVNLFTMRFFNSVHNQLTEQRGQITFLKPTPEVKIQFDAFPSLRNQICNELPKEARPC